MAAFEAALRKASVMAESTTARTAVEKSLRRGFFDVDRPINTGPPEATKKREEEMQSLYRVVVDGDDGGMLRENADRLCRALEYRNKYFNGTLGRRSHDPSAPPLRRNLPCTWAHGVATHPDIAPSVFPYSDFVEDVLDLYRTVENSGCATGCRQRLNFIQEIAKMMTLLNLDIESGAGQTRPGGIFNKAPVVDNAIHIERATPAHELLDVVIDQYEKAPHEPICKAADGSNVTIADVVSEADVSSPGEFTVAGLGWQPNRQNAARFDIFRAHDTRASKFSTAICKGALRTDGGLFPLLFRRLMQRDEQKASQGYTQAAEYRVSLLGTGRDELFSIARMFKTHTLSSPNHAIFFLRVGYNDFVKHTRHQLDEIKRLAELAKMGKARMSTKEREEAIAAAEAPVPTVQHFLRAIFDPLLDASLRPEESGATAWFLAQCGGVHLESQFERAGRSVVPPADLGTPDQVPFNDPRITDSYIDFYVWKNFTVLNSIRAHAKLNTMQLRRGVGGAAGLATAVGGYLFCDVLTNAAMLDTHPVMEYLCGMHRVGVTLSPLMNNINGLAYRDSPLARMFQCGLLVAVATEAPMHYHHTTNPLVEELGTAQKLNGLSGGDVAELARNSVRISSFPPALKKEWLGENAHLGSVSKYRIEFREELWRTERGMLESTFNDLQSGSKESQAVALWAKLSTVTDEEYFRVRDKRVRFPRTIIVDPVKQVLPSSVRSAAQKIVRALELRNRYNWKPQKPLRKREVSFEEALSKRSRKSDWTYASKDSVFIAFKRTEPQNWPQHLCTLEEFHQHLLEIKAICDDVDVKDFAYRRLEVLEYKYRLHLALNEENEAGANEGKAGMHNRDFYHASKVDTHIHMAAGMTGRQLRDFMLHKLSNNGDDIVQEVAGKVSTFNGIAKSLGVTTNLTVDMLNVQADHTLFQRFDNFNNKYNPMAQGVLRTMLLKTDNYMNGRYFAELINLTFAEYAKDQYTFAENRLSIYGIKLTEWAKLADWFDTHGMGSKHNKWLIQVPRVYKVFRGNNTISSFGQYIENIFKPLWEVSMEPHRFPRLHNFLEHVSGFDSVDNEATIDLPFSTISPWQWTAVENPPYNYYMYHLWANIRTLNEFRESQGMSLFTLRPHCGESGSDEHLTGCYLAADAINHGINLKNDPSIEYLYYLSQVGLAVSPLSNNALFLYFLKNPFDGFFRRGLNVSLSTDDPLMFHQTREPLIEEYSIAAKVWGFSMNDLCEIARNSVLQSGYSAEWKAEKLGPRFFFSSSLGNDPNRSHMSDIRQAYRFEAYHAECELLDKVSRRKAPRAMTTHHEENRFVEEEEVPHQNVVVSTQNEEMERLQRDIRDRRERIQRTQGELDEASKLHRGLVEQVSDLGARIAGLEEEVAALERPPPKAEVMYNRAGRGVVHVGDPSALVDLPAAPSRPLQELWGEFLVASNPPPPTEQQPAAPAGLLRGRHAEHDDEDDADGDDGMDREAIALLDELRRRGEASAQSTNEVLRAQAAQRGLNRRMAAGNQRPGSSPAAASSSTAARGDVLAALPPAPSSARPSRGVAGRPVSDSTLPPVNVGGHSRHNDYSTPPAPPRPRRP